jgi:WD40 repeat protein
MKSYLFIALWFSFVALNAQVRDKLRLGYDEESIVATQISVTVSVDGTNMAMLYDNAIAKVVDLKTGRPSRTFSVDKGELFSIRISQDNSKLIVISSNSYAIYLIKDGSLSTKRRLDSEVTRVEISPSQNKMVIGKNNGQFEIIDLNTYLTVKNC